MPFLPRAFGVCGACKLGGNRLNNFSVWLGYAAAHCNRHSETYREILGLKLYLNVVEKDRMNSQGEPEKTPARFEKLLPYAIALGVEKQWAKQFEGIYVTPPSWYNDRYSAFNSLIFVNSLNQFHSASSATLASAPSRLRRQRQRLWRRRLLGGGFGGGGGGSW